MIDKLIHLSPTLRGWSGVLLFLALLPCVAPAQGTGTQINADSVDLPSASLPVQLPTFVCRLNQNLASQ